MLRLATATEPDLIVPVTARTGFFAAKALEEVILPTMLASLPTTTLFSSVTELSPAHSLLMEDVRVYVPAVLGVAIVITPVLPVDFTNLVTAGTSSVSAHSTVTAQSFFTREI